ncbi:gamma-glutamyl-gamma-aminobutyrate hydrolase family protein [Aliarcobacter cryaerophilus]|uniref:gamma-glutamyl-gamma-aminobutyrate hydrolase family protein n=1 Tax=Aliarcobacter cryaerophilus TaxID=28198 RepID=UPI0021B532E7|nr:gamma-glutamyl-gamma-aminobutyrate hydrolase family protein [Aliarcobacter cryaerophilus]MCT7471125.1 gamma-glutamyl-gamma-aminobutyrate hydrolase family protein [Aliarcobacter cryaerophilus]
MKKILMSMRVTEASNYKEERNSIAFEYIEFFESLDFFIQLVPNNTKYLSEYFHEKVEAVVLTGGNNVNPKLYKSDEKLEDVYDIRDETEQKLIQEAINKNIPILGICKGFHLLNVYYGGKISHNIENHVNKNHTLESSEFILNGKSANSFHNQGIYLNDLAKNLEAIAKTKDNIVEAFRHKKDKVFAIQWHPERQNENYDKELINRFLKGEL